MILILKMQAVFYTNNSCHCYFIKPYTVGCINNCDTIQFENATSDIIEKAFEYGFGPSKLSFAIKLECTIFRNNLIL